jgi:hypothetical protein
LLLQKSALILMEDTVTTRKYDVVPGTLATSLDTRLARGALTFECLPLLALAPDLGFTAPIAT